MMTMTSADHNAGYRAAPTASPAPENPTQSSESGPLGSTATDSARLGHHENLTTSRGAAKLQPRSAVRALPAIDIDSLPRNLGRVVYFMRASNGLVKVGQSQDLRQRLRSQRASYPEAIDLLGYANVPNREIERAMHATLEKSHHHGEWFRPSKQFLFLLAATQTPQWRRAAKQSIYTRSDTRRWLEQTLAAAAVRLAEVAR